MSPLRGAIRADRRKDTRSFVSWGSTTRLRTDPSTPLRIWSATIRLGRKSKAWSPLPVRRSSWNTVTWWFMTDATRNHDPNPRTAWSRVPTGRNDASPSRAVARIVHVAFERVAHGRNDPPEFRFRRRSMWGLDCDVLMSVDVNERDPIDHRSPLRACPTTGSDGGDHECGEDRSTVHRLVRRSVRRFGSRTEAVSPGVQRGGRCGGLCRRRRGGVRRRTRRSAVPYSAQDDRRGARATRPR